MAQAESHFADPEIDIARSSLWKAANDKKALIGEMIAHKTPGKTKGNEDTEGEVYATAVVGNK